MPRKTSGQGFSPRSTRRSPPTPREVYEGYLPAILGLASLTIRAGREDERLAGLLQEIAMRAEDAEWRAWAERERVGMQAAR